MNDDLDAGGFGAYTPEPPRPGVGHNKPPLEELLAEDTADIRKRSAELLASLGRAPVDLADEPTVKGTLDLAGMMRRCAKEADTVFHTHKDPVVQTGRAIDNYFRGIRDPLDQGARELDRRVTVYRNRILEKQRKEREAAERAAAAAEAANRPPPPVPEPSAPPPLRGDLGTLGTVRKVWKSEVTGRVPLEQLRRYIKDEEIKTFIDRAVRDGVRELKNVKIWLEEEVRGR